MFKFLTRKTESGRVEIEKVEIVPPPFDRESSFKKAVEDQVKIDLAYQIEEELLKLENIEMFEATKLAIASGELVSSETRNKFPNAYHDRYQFSLPTHFRTLSRKLAKDILGV